MSTKKLPPYVTEQRLASLLSRFAAAADASFSLKLNAMEQRLRDEFAPDLLPPTYEGNHLAPSTDEGAE